MGVRPACAWLGCRVLLLVLALLVVGCGGGVSKWTTEGDRLLRDNDLVGAEKAYNRAIAIDSHHAPALYGKGWALYLSGHENLIPAARQLFSRCIDYDPEYWGGYRGMGVLLLDDDKVAAAETMLRNAYEKNDREATVLLSLGQMYLRASKFEEALQLFEGAIGLEPQRGEFMRFLAELEMRQGNHAKALQWITEGRARAVSGRRGLLLLDEGELRVHLDRARVLVAKSLGADDPGLPEALRALDAADSLLEKAIQSDERLRNAGQRKRYHQRLRQQVETAMGG
ncbi:MAG: tetratricopeptide repeat protein [Deltaproteobacteria bacterium]|nr:tetratricopeptide repeat protein [Deltaproteobacteria bacterium]